jgi:hypothetical protein
MQFIILKLDHFSIFFFTKFIFKAAGLAIGVVGDAGVRANAL